VTPETVTCPSCKAVLISDEEQHLPGVTAVDDKVLRGEKPPPPRNRLLSWISGEYTDETPTPANTEAIAPPDAEVQREIRRLEIEAETANLQAEADALQSVAVIEGRLVEVPEGIRPLEIDESAAAAVAAGAGTEGAPVSDDDGTAAQAAEDAPTTEAAADDNAATDDSTATEVTPTTEDEPSA
jgi:hypothetical protein